MSNRTYTRNDTTLVRLYAYVCRQHLPWRCTQESIARELRVSRATVNYALMFLQKNGIIEADTTPGRGTTIRHVRKRAMWHAVSEIACGLPALTAYMAEYVLDKRLN